MNRSYKELNEKALEKGDQADRIDAVEPFLEKITYLTVWDSRHCATATLVSDGSSGWAVAIYDVRWSKVYNARGLIRPRTPRHSAKNA
jgi:hypothetical protein